MSNPNSVIGGAVLQFLVLFILTLVSYVTVLWRRIMIGVGVGLVFILIITILLARYWLQRRRVGWH